MSFYTMADNNVPITANRDGALYNVALSNQTFIIKGLGDELAPTCEGLQFSVGTGIAVLKGRHVTCQQISDANTITLPSNTSGYVVMRMDLSRPLGTEAYLFATPTLTQEEINWNGIIYDMPIATFTSTLTNATIEDVRVVVEKTSGLEYTEIEPVETTPMEWVDLIYPVGSVYFSVDATNPAQKFIGTAWQLMGDKLAVRENVFGNGYTLGITDRNGGLFGLYGGGATTNAYASLYGKHTNETNQGSGNYTSGYGIGVPTKELLGDNPQYSGLIIDADTIYSWKRVA